MEPEGVAGSYGSPREGVGVDTHGSRTAISRGKLHEWRPEEGVCCWEWRPAGGDTRGRICSGDARVDRPSTSSRVLVSWQRSPPRSGVLFKSVDFLVK